MDTRLTLAEIQTDPSGNAFAFRGIVASRSSTSSREGPPGESAILKLNDRRVERIREATGWSQVFPGTLNLGVLDETVHRLLLCDCAVKEHGDEVNYPAPYDQIPKARVGYLYYHARLSNAKGHASVLVRRACLPLLNLVEVFSDTSLREKLQLSDGDLIYCEVGVPMQRNGCH